MTVIEYGSDIIIVDCGMSFPDKEMPGIDVVIPDMTYIAGKKRGERAGHTYNPRP